MDGWIVIPNWDKFQAYRDRNPPWIKLWTELNSRDDWLRLSCAQRGLLCTSWVEYARSKGVARTEHILSLCGPGTRASQLQPLIDAGFIQVVANKPSPIPRKRCKPESEKRREEKALDASPPKPKKDKRVPFSTQSPPQPGRVNMPAIDAAAYVRGLIQNGVITEPFELDDYDLDDRTRNELRQQLH